MYAVIPFDIVCAGADVLSAFLAFFMALFCTVFCARLT